MCNNNNSDSGGGSRPDKLAENGFHFEIAAVPAADAASFCGGDKCDNNNVTYDSNSNSNSNSHSNSSANSQFQALQLKRSSAPTHSRSKSMPRLFKSMSLSVQGNGSKNGSAVLQHQQSLGVQHSGFRCVCCEHVAEKQQKHKERRYSLLWLELNIKYTLKFTENLI